MPTFQKSLLRNSQTHKHTLTHVQTSYKEQPRFYALFFLSNSHEDFVRGCKKIFFFRIEVSGKRRLQESFFLLSTAAVSDICQHRRMEYFTNSLKNV